VDEAEKLVNEYLAATSKLSTGEAARLSGVPKSTVADLRNGKRPNFQPKTWRKIEEYVEQSRPGSVTHEPANLTASVVHLLATDPERIRELVALLMDEKIRPLWDKG
jgi:hypothetical protein